MAGTRYFPWSLSRAFLGLAGLGLVARLGFVLLARGNQLTFLSGGSDAPVYALLAGNLVRHRGFTYAGQPTAFRPPGYPLLLAGAIKLFGAHYITFVRLLQYLLGIATAALCADAALRVRGRRAAEAAFLVALFLPTLVFPTAQILTECLAAFFTALYLRFLVVQQQHSDIRSSVGLGLTAGIESLVHFNAAALAPFGGLVVLGSRNSRARIPRLLLVLGIPLLVVSPWLIRNAKVFHGHFVFSTETGAVAVQGVLTPEGRTQVGDVPKLLAAMSWWLPELETNSPVRLSLPSETELNRRALLLSWSLWKKEGWHAIPLLARKISDFWLSLDQLIDTRSFSLRQRAIRAVGVLVYWTVLALAVCGWLALRRRSPRIAYLFLAYAIFLTVLHFPFVMNTRLRIPLIDPLLVILAGAGWESIRARYLEDSLDGRLERSHELSVSVH